ncbi:hypothetical protein AMTR_s00150p00047850 [Amborella trichopoda]|uniref:Uncharacterized protein n=1 Tax=Amborella trichopoda TaxID=13333 RepID=W1PK99_AMBTC|nr:hypothetical protein AMTR_s00150p00047850 [Amborella trichopoda]
MEDPKPEAAPVPQNLWKSANLKKQGHPICHAPSTAYPICPIVCGLPSKPLKPSKHGKHLLVSPSLPASSEVAPSICDNVAPILKSENACSPDPFDATNTLVHSLARSLLGLADLEFLDGKEVSSMGNVPEFEPLATLVPAKTEDAMLS